MQKHHAEEIVALQRENAHLREAQGLWQLETNLSEEGEVELTTVGLTRATNLSIYSNMIPPTFNTLQDNCRISRTISSLASWRWLFLPTGRI